MAEPNENQNAAVSDAGESAHAATPAVGEPSQAAIPVAGGSTQPAPAASPDAPLVSVIVPMYKCEAYIGQCLQSLKDQTLASWEALCVNDASPDRAWAVARETAGDDPRFWFDSLPENRGQSAARNVALDRARGTYVVLLDSDDYLVPDALEKLVRRAESQQLDDLYFNGKSFYESMEMHKLVREDYSLRPAFDGVATGMQLFTFFENAGQFFPQAALRMVRRDLIQENGIRFYEGIIHEDVLFTFRTLVASRRSSFLNEPLYMRRVHEGSTMTQPKRTIANVRGHFVCVREMEAWLSDHAAELDDDFMEAVAHRIHDYNMLQARDWFADIDEADQKSFWEELSPRDRLRFQVQVLQPGAEVKQLNEEFYQSKTYRVGNALLAVPRKLRDGISEARTYNKEK